MDNEIKIYDITLWCHKLIKKLTKINLLLLLCKYHELIKKLTKKSIYDITMWCHEFIVIQNILILTLISLILI